MHASLLLLTSDPSFEVTTTGDGGGVFAGFMVIFLAFMVFALAATVFWVWMLVDAAKAPEVAWEAIGQNKTLWIVLAVLLGVVISLLHFFWLRPKLKAVTNY